MTESTTKNIQKKPNCPKCKKGYMEVYNPFVDEYQCNACGHKAKCPDPIQIMIGSY